jgi:hypothetical protein
LKKETLKYATIILVIAFVLGCSTKKNTFVSRNTHALSSKYNILYNGGVALDKGVEELKLQYKDNFWEILPVERMQVVEEKVLPEEQQRNPNFERAETKSTKAIQKHSMNIGGSEKNPQMDEAHLMLGKSRYYDQRFVPALEAFNYVLYKYPTSDKINEVKIWREKTNMRLDNDETAITNLSKLLKEIKFKDQIFADANATLAQAFLNTKQNDSAIAKLRLATQFTKSNEEKARYRFIMGQIFDQTKQKDSANIAYQEVIDMKRKAPKQYVIRSHANQAQYFDFANGDTLAFTEKFNDLLKDRENRPYLDVLNHQMGVFYDKQKLTDNAIKYYNKSLKIGSSDQYLIASNYRNLAEINFNKAKYVIAGKYYDSTLAVMNDKTREYKLIAKKRENLDDVIKFEKIAHDNDSILNISKMSKAEREIYFKEFIEKLKLEDQKKKELEAKQVIENKNPENQNIPSKTAEGKKIDPEYSSKEAMTGQKSAKNNSTIPTASSSVGVQSNFYFYNPNTIATGKIEFKKRWGNRSLIENWRLQKENNTSSNNEVTNNNETKTQDEKFRYSPDFYIGQIPSSQNELDAIAKERNFAYYQLGVIYKEKFKEYPRAADKFETLLQNNPEERLVLPSLYNLYKIYEITNSGKANEIKTRIINLYPDSRYAQILNNNAINVGLGSPDEEYKKLYKNYEQGAYRETLTKTDIAIVQYTGEEILSKYELLKANLIGKLYGLTEFKKALNFVALTYPNSEEGKKTEDFIKNRLPQLEALSFNSETPSSWKILYNANLDTLKNKSILTKINKFIKGRDNKKLIVTTDIYTIDKNLIVIHGIKTKEEALQYAQLLKDYKDFKITEKAIVISSENYQVIQAKKNIEVYIAENWLEKEIVPKDKNVYIPTSKQETKVKKLEIPVKKETANPKTTQPKIEQPNTNMPRLKNEMESDDKPGSSITPPAEPKKP